MISQDDVKPGSPKEDEDKGDEGERREEGAKESEGDGLHQGLRPGTTRCDEDREGETSDDETKEVR